MLVQTVLAVLAVVDGAAANGAVLVEPWGEGTLRVRMSLTAAPVDTTLPTSLLPRPPPAARSPGTDGAEVTSGNLEATTDAATGLRQFTRISDRKSLLREVSVTAFAPTTTTITAGGGGGGEGGIVFRATIAADHLYGLGMQRQTCYAEGGLQTPALGLVLPAPSAGDPNPTVSAAFNLAAGEGGAANTLPWLMAASPGAGATAGFFLNVPAMGNVTFRYAAATAATGTGGAAVEMEWYAASHLGPCAHPTPVATLPCGHPTLCPPYPVPPLPVLTLPV